MVDKSGVAGLPAGVKAQGRIAQVRSEDLTLVPESMGTRLMWARASVCYCLSAFSQSNESNPTCVECNGGGWVFFSPAIAYDEDSVGTLTSFQKAVMDDNNGSIIVGAIQRVTGQDNAYDTIRRRLTAMAYVTTRQENKLGYYDRLVAIDAEIPYSEYKICDGAATTQLSYPIICVNLLRTATKTYELTTDYTVEAGAIKWQTTPPVDGTKLVAHYNTMPFYRVMEFPHLMRVSLQKIKGKQNLMPMGDPQQLPVQTMIQLEFAVNLIDS